MSYFRDGPIHRSVDEFISFREVRERFGFRAIKIGRWVTEEEQQRAALNFYDALCDLQVILQVPASVISLRGSLALHYGTGGRPGVAAHYSPLEQTFALAKNAGPGSIAHEWFHAFDHYIAHKFFRSCAALDFASALWVSSRDIIHHPLNQCLSEFFHAVLLSDDGEGPSDLFQYSKQYDHSQAQVYYAKPEELCARAFEAYIEDAKIKNSFLVRGTINSQEAKIGLYPRYKQRANINKAAHHYFTALGAALMT